MLDDVRDLTAAPLAKVDGDSLDRTLHTRTRTRTRSSAHQQHPDQVNTLRKVRLRMWPDPWPLHTSQTWLFQAATVNGAGTESATATLVDGAAADST